MPQNKPITYIAQIEYLQSFDVIKKLIDEFLFTHNDGFEGELLSKVKINNSSTHDLGMEDSFDFLKNELSFDILKIYDYLSNRHYIIDNGKVNLCGETLEEYHLLSSAIDTAPLLSSFVLGYTEYLDDINRLRYIDNNLGQSQLFYGKFKKKIKEISDNHIHLGGSLNFDYRLHKILIDPDKVDLSKRPDELFIKITECEVGIKNIIFSISILETIIVKLAIADKHSSSYMQTMQDLSMLLKGLKGNNQADIKELYHTYIYSIRDYHNKQYFNINNRNLEFEFLIKSMEYFHISIIPKADKFLVLFLMKTLSTHKELKEPIEIYLILRNILKVYIVQQHKREGFGYFATYTDNSVRRAKDEEEKEHIIKSIFNSKIATNIEGRITLKNDETSLINSILDYIIPFEKLKKKKKSSDRLKFMFHFIKDTEEEYKRSEDKLLYGSKSRWQKLRKVYKQQAMTLNSILTNPAYRKYTNTKLQRENYEEKLLDGCIKLSSIEKNCLQESSETINFVANYISGIDAANKEYKTPPEVFAPIYRFFKNGIETSGLVLSREYPYVDIHNDNTEELNFQYSFHVGEEFRDILSGLRAIFEAVLFLDLKENDRIGHALALGIDAKKFIHGRKDRTFSKLEVLDNAIFAYYILGKYSHNFTTVKDDLKNIILGLSKEIYKKNKESHYYHIDDLIDAWFLRRNCPNEVMYCKELLRDNLENNYNNIYDLKKLLENEDYHPIISNLNYVKSAIPDFFPFQKTINYKYAEKYRSVQNNPNAYELYWKYNNDIDVKEKGAKIYEYNTLYESKFYEYMQDIMMEHIIAKQDIIIETLPSSNILIGQFSHYSQHPITRFKPVRGKIKPNSFGIRKKRLRVVIGTDNPGLQNTTLLGEIYQLKHALEKNKHYSKHDVEKYLLDIIEEGNELWR